MSQKIALPANACDAHMHIFGPVERFPYVKTRSYTPQDATIDQYLDIAETNCLSRFVLIQPSVYGVDNSLLLTCLKKYQYNARGVVVIYSDIGQKNIDEMHLLGVRGVRYNLLFPGGPALDDIPNLSRRIKPQKWHIQILMDIAKLPEVANRLSECDIPLVFDHFGHFDPRSQSGRAGFECLVELVKSGIAWVKLSAPYRLSLGGPPYSELQRITEKLILTNEKRLLWGSDWPHPQTPENPPALSETLALLTNWINDEQTLQRIMVCNPQALYRF